jgi:hypothetical protein
MSNFFEKFKKSELASLIKQTLFFKFFEKYRKYVKEQGFNNFCRSNIESAVKQIYSTIFKKPLDLNNPITINEKLQWLKLNTYYNNPIITQCVDKYKVKEYLKNKGFDDLVVELYGVYDNAKDIIWDILPEKFVIKCNHGCGYNILCENKDKLDIKNVEKQLNNWLKEDYWTLYAEPQYKYIDKKIIIEQYLGDNINTYKFYCFNGKPKILYISSRGDNIEFDKYIDYFNMDFIHLNIQLEGHEHFPGEILCPSLFSSMKKYASKLSEGFPFVRIDLYEIEGKIFLSEFTFIPTGGYMHLSPDGTDSEWGNWLVL